MLADRNHRSAPKRESDSQPHVDLVFGGLASNLFFFDRPPLHPVYWFINQEKRKSGIQVINQVKTRVRIQKICPESRNPA